jgi:hypothetical protein
MFSRILGIIVCLCIIALGVLFISSSSTSNMAPMISGTTMIFVSFIVLTAICISMAEKIMGIVTDQYEGTGDLDHIDPFQDDFTFHRDLNTPDPHLIHPDDTKRAARLNMKV